MLLACSITLQVTRPEAVLPPPFPSSKPERFYLSNLAVASPFRNRGVASTLVRAGETLARRWGHASAWLHVDKGNDGAERLYVKCGYKRWGEDPWWIGPLGGRTLLCKPLPPTESMRALMRVAAKEAAVAVRGGGGESLREGARASGTGGLLEEDAGQRAAAAAASISAAAGGAAAGSAGGSDVAHGAAARGA